MRVRTLFLSDIHLGTKGCQADKLLDFLRHYEADTDLSSWATSSTDGS